MRAIYIADDGTQFNDEFECMEYEEMLAHPGLDHVTWILEDGNVAGKLRCTDDFVYQHCVRIIVPSDEAAEDLRWLAQYTGFCDYEEISGMGTWEFQGDGWNGKYVKVEG